MSDNDLPRSKAGMRGKMLVVWFAEASPPVLWRFLASDVSGGFGLRPGDGKTELVSYDGAGNPQLIASFTSEASAERALARMSRTLLSYKAPWKKVVKALTAIIILLLLLLVLPELLQLQTLNALSSMGNLKGLQTAGYTGKTATPPLLLPGMASQATKPAAPSGPPQGSPVDVDKFYK